MQYKNKLRKITGQNSDVCRKSSTPCAIDLLFSTKSFKIANIVLRYAPNFSKALWRTIKRKNLYRTVVWYFVPLYGYIWASPVAQMVKNPPAMWETWVCSLGWEDLLEKEMEAHSSILAWRIPMDRGAWWATVHGVTKSQTQLSSRHGMACFIFVWIKLERINFTAFCILQKGIFNILRASCGYTDSWDITVRKNYIMSLACEWQRENCFLLQREKS